MSEKMLVPLIYGEVLFDHFATGESVLGGAPFNVAWHLQGLGLEPLFASRIGEDKDGRTVRKAMQEWGMAQTLLQLDPVHPTGTVSVTIENDEPAYTINSEQAYDFIDYQAMRSVVDPDAINLVYFGSLIRRGPESRQSLEALLNDYSGGAFVDINLRVPWYESQDLIKVIDRARWLKLNQDEYSVITGHQPAGAAELLTDAKEFRSAHDLDMLVITSAEEGAAIITADQVCTGTAPEVTDFMDAVGAGDAFSAVCIFGLLHNWSAEEILQRALNFAASVCQFRGALIEDASHYLATRESWNA